MQFNCLAVSLLLCISFVCGTVPAMGSNGADKNGKSADITISNKYISLTFDKDTGAWTQFIDRATGDNLLVEPCDTGIIPPDKPLHVDTDSIKNALDKGEAISLDGEWLYTPTPGQNGEPYLRGDFGSGEWAPTLVPSQLDAGDGRLHNRFGDFWYRREFSCPPDLLTDDLMLVIGAVDDFDETFINGVRVGKTGMETPHFWESTRYYQVPQKLLHSDRPNILLIKVTNGGFDGGIWGPVVLDAKESMGIPPAPAPAPMKAHSVSRTGNSSILRMSTVQGSFEYEITYTLPDDKNFFSRRLVVKNPTSQTQSLTGIMCSLPSMSVGPHQSVIFPGTIPVGDTPVESMQDRDVLGTKGMDPLAILWDAGKKRGIGTWYNCEDEWSPVSVRRLGSGASLRHNQQIFGPIKPGESFELGTQYVWLGHGSRDSALRGIQQIYKSIGLRAPGRGLTDLRKSVLYCGHPGGTPELNYRYYGGFKAVEAYVPTLRKLGVSLLWLLPIWEHGDGTVWNLYSPFDQFKVSPIYGTPEELKSLSSACSENGINLIFDLVPHGPPDITPLAKEHPEWNSKDQEGKPVYEWSQLAFDYANPGWQDYMRRAAEWNAREYGAIGARVDCGAGGPSNWDPACGHRPNQSALYGGLGMNKAIRDGFLKAKKQVVLLPEEYTGANVFYRVSDLTYDSQLFFHIMDLKAKNASPEEWAGSLQSFMHDQAMTMPPGALKMRFISNHDTVSWTFQAKRPAIVYGVDHMRALLSLCALVEGVPMLYQGDEDPAVYGGTGVSSVDFLSRIYQLRKSIPAIGNGSVDYRSVKATGGVFACRRQTPKQNAVVLISFNPSVVRSTISTAGLLSGTWTDCLSGEKVGLTDGAKVEMASYQVRVLIQDR
ncbi:MAG: alpha-amylase family glycosyl hydrolase [Armatimonadota bacterium]